MENKQVAVIVIKDSAGFFDGKGKSRLVSCGKFLLARIETISRVDIPDATSQYPVRAGDVVIGNLNTTVIDGDTVSETVITYVVKESTTGLLYWMIKAQYESLVSQCNECCIPA